MTSTGTSLISPRHAPDPTLDAEPPSESRVAHIGRAKGSMICLCGCRGVRRCTAEEARKAGYCVVCYDLYYGDSPRSDGPTPRFEISDEDVIALLAAVLRDAQ